MLNERTNTLYQAVFESTNFSFQGFGGTKDQAEKALKKAIRKHCRQYDVSFSYFEGYWEDVQYVPFLLGDGFRDGDLLTTGAKA